MVVQTGLEQRTLRQAVAAFLVYLRDYRRRQPLTVTSYAGDLEGFLSFAQSMDVHSPTDVSRQVVLAYARSLALAPRTVRRRIACLSSFFRFLMEIGVLQANPAQGVPLPAVPSALPRALSREQITALMEAVRGPYERCVLTLLLMTGLRRGELCALRTADVHFEESQVLVRGKGNRQRILPLGTEAMSAIRAYVAQRNGTPSEALLVNHIGHPLQGQTVNMLMRKVSTRVGFVVTPHILRHTFATHLARNGVDVETIRALMGHASLLTTAIYMHSDTRTKAVAVASLRSLLE